MPSFDAQSAVGDSPSTRNSEGSGKVNKRIQVLLMAAMMLLVAMMAVSGAALAQGGEVSVSNNGETKVGRGTSTCSSDATSHAVAVNDSEAGTFINSEATATNSSAARAFDN